MARQFITADYQATLDLEISLREALPPDHLAHFIVEVVAELDLSRIYRGYGQTGAPPYAPEILLGLLFYGYATGVYSSRKIEAATRYSIPFRFIAGNLHPDHDTIATFRKQFLNDLKDLFVQILLMAQAMGLLEVGDISIDGTKIHASASKHSAVSYKRLLEIEAPLQSEVEPLEPRIARLIHHTHASIAELLSDPVVRDYLPFVQLGNLRPRGEQDFQGVIECIRDSGLTVGFEQIFDLTAQRGVAGTGLVKVSRAQAGIEAGDVLKQGEDLLGTLGGRRAAHRTSRENH